MYGIIIYTIVVLPVLIKKLKRTRVLNRTFLILNIIVSLFIFTFFFSEFRIQLWDFYNQGINSLYCDNKDVGLSKTYVVLVKIFYFFLSIYFAGLILNISMLKEKSRILLLKSFLPVWVILSNYFYVYYLEHINSPDTNRVLVFVVTFILLGVGVLVLYIFYRNKHLRHLFTQQRPK